MSTRKKKPKQLSPEMVKALSAAKVAIRSTADMIEGDIVDIYEIGDDRGVPIQSAEVQIEGESEPRRYVFKGADTITSIFGKPDEEEQLSKIEYDEDGIPLRMSVPDVGENPEGVRWYQLRKG
jgi:hypothetical protein